MSDNTFRLLSDYYFQVLLFYMLSLGIFCIFCSLRKKLSMSNYGSAALRIESLNNRNGSYIKKTLYLTIFMTFG